VNPRSGAASDGVRYVNYGGLRSSRRGQSGGTYKDRSNSCIHNP
jgi:hypothetical protein